MGAVSLGFNYRGHERGNYHVREQWKMGAAKENPTAGLTGGVSDDYNAMLLIDFCNCHIKVSYH